MGISAAAVAGIAIVLHRNKQARNEILNQLGTKQAFNRARKVDEHDAIYNYVLSSYGLNRRLRSPEGVEALNERDRTIVKGLDSWLSDAPQNSGTYFRGIPGLADTEWAKAKPGDIVVDRAYTSFSNKRDIAEAYASSPSSKPGVLIVSQGSMASIPYHVANRYGNTLGDTVKKESEFLTERNSKFEVTRTESLELRFKESPITGEEVPDPNGPLIRRLIVVYVNKLSTYGRADAPDAKRGKPCGESHIPRNRKCTKGTATLTAGNLRTAAKIALGVGLLAGGIAIARKWNAKDQQQLNEALKNGKTWNVYDRKLSEDALDPDVELLRQQRKADQNQFCGLTSGKTKAGRSDAYQPCSRQIGDVSAYGKIYLHTSDKVCFKVPTGNQNITQQRAMLAADNEFTHLVLAENAGVRVPKPISMSPSNIIKMEYVPNADTLREFLRNGDPSRFDDVSKDLFQSLHKMHKAGIAHRDMHSGNILIGADNRAHIIDFGLAVSAKVHGLTDLTTRNALAKDMERSTLLLTTLGKLSDRSINEVDRWVTYNNLDIANLASNYSITTQELENYVDKYYYDIYRAITFKRKRPATSLKPGMTI